MNPTKRLAAVATSFILLVPSVHAETSAFYADKVVKNCAYPTAMKRKLTNAFSAEELRVLRILSVADDSTCQQTGDYLRSHKADRKSARSYIEQQYRAHRQQIEDAEASD